MAIQVDELATLEGLPAESVRALLLRLIEDGTSDLGDLVALLMRDLGYLERVKMSPEREWFVRRHLLSAPYSATTE